MKDLRKFLTAGLMAGLVLCGPLSTYAANTTNFKRNVTIAGTTTLSGPVSISGAMTYTAVPTFPATGIKFNTGNLTTLKPISTMAQVTVFTIPDPAAGTANLVIDAGASTLAGVRTFSSIPVFPNTGITFNTANKETLVPTAPGQTTSLNIADPGNVTGYLWSFAAAQTATGVLSRGDLATNSAQKFNVNMLGMRNLDGTVMDATGGAGKFKITTPASFGAGSVGVKLTSEAANNNTKTDVCCFEWRLPDNYVAGSAITLHAFNQVIIGGGTLGGTKTFTCDAYKIADANTAGSNLGPAAYTLTTSNADGSFTITPTGLVAGDKLFFQLQTAIQETASSNITQDITGMYITIDIKG